MDKSEKVSPKSGSERPRRTIKRYSNRKLYDTRDSRYVTLLQIAEMIRAGEDVQIIDNATKEDKTEVTLALIISEELRAQPRSVPLVTLRNLIHQRGEKLLSQLREGPIRRLIPGAVDARPSEEGETTEPTPAAANPAAGVEPPVRGWQQLVEERVAAALSSSSLLGTLRAEVERLSGQIAALEARLAGRKGPDDRGGGGAPPDA